MVLTCKAEFPLYVLAVMVWFWIRTVYSCGTSFSYPSPSRMLRSLFHGTLMARRSPYLRTLYCCMSAVIAMPTTINVHPRNQDHPFRSSGRELHSCGKSTNDVVSVMIWTGKVRHTYWLPWTSVNVDPVIVISLEFENIPVDGGGIVNACHIFC